jgi:RNA polymerase sigma factor (sigma-70 family)
MLRSRSAGPFSLVSSRNCQIAQLGPARGRGGNARKKEFAQVWRDLPNVSGRPGRRPGSKRRCSVPVEVERPNLVRAIRPFGLSAADLDDVVQVAVTELALSWNDRLARLPVCELYAHVLRTAHLRARDAVRREKRRLQREARFHSVPPEAPLDPERKILLERERTEYLYALRKLPPWLREPLVLSIEGDLTASQIAAILGVPVGTVKTRLRKARALCGAPRVFRQRLEAARTERAPSPRKKVNR